MEAGASRLSSDRLVQQRHRTCLARLEPIVDFRFIRPDRASLLVEMFVDRQTLKTVPTADGSLALVEIGGDLLPRVDAIGFVHGLK